MAAITFTKLVVGDLDKSAAFYEAVFDLERAARVDSEIDGRPIAEIIYRQSGAMTFVLLAYTDAPKPAGGEIIIGASAEDVDALVEKVKAAGGSVVTAPVARPEHGAKVGFVRDVEGHLIEVIQFLK